MALGLVTLAEPFEGRPVLEELEHRLHPVSSYVVLPLFAVANAGVSLSADSLRAAATSRIVWGKAFTGAQLDEAKIGVLAASLLAGVVGALALRRLTARPREPSRRVESAAPPSRSTNGPSTPLDIVGPPGHSRGMATTARHQGTCGRCQRPINIGDKIAKSDRVIGWLHEECAEMSDEAEEIPASDFADRYRTGPTDR